MIENIEQRLAEAVDIAYRRVHTAYQMRADEMPSLVQRYGDLRAAQGRFEQHQEYPPHTESLTCEVEDEIEALLEAAR